MSSNVTLLTRGRYGAKYEWLAAIEEGELIAYGALYGGDPGCAV